MSENMAQRVAGQAAITERPGAPFRIEPLAIDPPGPGQIRVRIHACGVCHTDMVMRDGALPIPFPTILGHEGAGVVDAVGADVSGLSVGDHVLLSFASCGVCLACDDHQPGYCDAFVSRNFMGDGANDPANGGLWRGDVRVPGDIFGQSSFATYALTHTRNAVKIDADLPLDILAPLGCGIQTGAGTILETLAVLSGQAVLVLGVGAVGLSAVMAAAIAGAGRITVIDRHRARLDLARELGAHEVCDDLSMVPGGFDHAVDTTGVAALLPVALGKLRQRGTLALVGAYAPGAVGFEPAEIMSMGRRIVGVVEGGIDPQHFIPQLIGHYRAGHLPLERIVTHFDFADIAHAVAQAEDGSVVKPVLRMV